MWALWLPGRRGVEPRSRQATQKGEFIEFAELRRWSGILVDAQSTRGGRVPSTEFDPSAQLSRMRGTRVDALSDNEPLTLPNNGRQEVPRMEPVQPLTR